MPPQGSLSAGPDFRTLPPISAGQVLLLQGVAEWVQLEVRLKMSGTQNRDSGPPTEAEVPVVDQTLSGHAEASGTFWMLI